MVRWIFIAFCLAAGMIASQAAENARQNDLDVVVRDSRGHIVRELESADFVMTEDGVTVPVRQLRTPDPKAPHLVSLLFGHVEGEAARMSRDGAIELLNAAGRADVQFAVFGVDGKLAIYQPFTSDRKAVRTAIEQATGKHPKDATPTPHEPESETSKDATDLAGIVARIPRTAEKLANENRVPPALSALLAIAQEQQAIPGRKALVFFSEGLPIADVHGEGFRSVLNAINRARVSVYSVDASGLSISRQEEASRAAALQQNSTASPAGLPLKTPQSLPSGATEDSWTRPLGSRKGLAAAAREASTALAALAEGTGGFLVSDSNNYRTPLRRVPEDLTAYYDLAYTPRDDGRDGKYHLLRVSVTRKKVQPQSRDGYFAVPDLEGHSPQPYEIPLLEVLRQPQPAHDFPYHTAVFQFRNGANSRSAVSVAVEVPIRELQFTEDPAAGLLRGHLSMAGLVRGPDGKVVERFARDISRQCPPRLLDELRERFLLFQDQFALAPGSYTLEVAMQDRESGRLSAGKSAFIVAPLESGFGLSSLAVVREVVPGEPGDTEASLFRLQETTVLPALDGAVPGGKGAMASLFLQLYPQDGAAPVHLELELLRDGKRIVGSPLVAKPSHQKAQAEIISLDVSRLPPGTYEARVFGNQGETRREARTPLVISGEAQPESAANEPLTAEAAIQAQPAGELPAVAPNARQQHLLEEAAHAVAQYSEHLPNFICTQVTRRLLDPAGKGQWRSLDENTQLLSYFDGKEHYHQMASRLRASDPDSWSASMTSSGEFGSLLRQVFGKESEATFAWLRAESLRGRQVQVFTYAVNAAHSKYRVAYNSARGQAPVFSPFHGLVFLDQETAVVRKLTLETDVLPSDFPVRRVALSMDYEDVAVGGSVYLLPMAVSLDLRLHKKTVVRNEVTFRSYQRFTTDSRIVSYGGAEP